MYNRNDIKDIYTLTPMQKGMLYHSLYDAKSSSHFVQNVLELDGTINEKLFEECLNRVIARYDILRTVFLYDKVKEPVQIVLKERKTKVFCKDISFMNENEKSTYIERFCEEDRKKGFNLSTDLLIRLSIIKECDKKYKVIWSFHHIIMDGWCIGIIMNDFLKIYYSLKKDLNLELPTVYPYSEFIKWIEAQDREKSKEYWKQYLEGYEEQTILPGIKNSNDITSYIQGEEIFTIEEKLSQGLKEIAKLKRVTLNIVLQAIWGIILQRYNNRNDVVFGMVASGRPAEILGIENMLGLFINTIPIRVKANAQDTFGSLINRMQCEVSYTHMHEYYPLVEIQNNTKLKQDLINHILVFENYPFEDNFEIKDSKEALDFSIKESTVFEQTSFNFNIIVLPGNELTVKINYNASLFDKMIIENIEMSIKNVINQVISNPEIEVRDIEVLAEKERQRLLYEFNNTGADYPRDKTIHELFEDQVNKTPNDIAVIYKEEKLTYKELNKRANRVAKILKANGIGRDDIVGIMVERSVDMIVGIMGILKSGGAYIAIDPEYPEDRIKYMIEDSDVKILLTQMNQKSITSFNGKLIILDEENTYEDDIKNIESMSEPNGRVYVIYTSGSTGKPKGIEMTHRNLINLIYYQYNKTDIDFNTRILQFTSISFDVSYQEIFSTLLRGGQLYLINIETRLEANKLLNFISKNDIEVVFLPTSYLKYLSSNEEYISRFSHKIKHLITAGEQLIVNQQLKAYLTLNGVSLHNHYGPSEAHVVTTYEILPTTSIMDIPPVGKPISNTRIYILNEKLHLSPIGTSGELCISGDCVGRGYLNKPELTAEKFVENPFEPGERMYKTGDLARWLPDGNIEFLGRIDHQVKIRGFRIELGEIENRLLSHESIKEAVVVAKEDENGSKYLCAYIVGSKELMVGELREHLGKELPEYMIPSYLMQLEKLPLDANGKIDRKALPEIDGQVDTGVEYEAPRNEIEAKLVEIWKEVLKIERIGINDSFFALGGHSLKATSLVAKIHKELNAEVPLREIFKTPTIKGLAEAISSMEKRMFYDIQKVEKSEYYPVSSAQRRLLILNQRSESDISYNMPFAMMIEGLLDVQAVKNAFEELIHRHEVFRTGFYSINGEFKQRIFESVEFDIEYKEVYQLNIDHIKRFVKVFDLSKPPLLRVSLIKMDYDKYVLLLDMHHIISDGVSIRILMKEFASLYEGKSLPELKLQYKDYSVWQNNLLKSDMLKKQRSYWLETLKDFSYTELPRVRAATDENIIGSSKKLIIDKAAIDSIRKYCMENNVSESTFLMAVLKIIIHEYTYQKDLTIGIPTAGRNHDGLDEVAGLFLNVLVIRTKLDINMTFIEYLKILSNMVLEAQDNQQYPYEELYADIKEKTGVNHASLFSILYNYMPREDREIQLRDIRIKPLESGLVNPKYDVTLYVRDELDSIALNLVYKSGIYKDYIMEGILNSFLTVINTVLENCNIEIGEIILSKDELIEESASAMDECFENEDFFS